MHLVVQLHLCPSLGPSRSTRSIFSNLIFASILWLDSLGFLLFRNPWLSRIVWLLLRFLPPFLQFGHYRQGIKLLARLFCGTHRSFLRNKRTFTRYDVVVRVTLRENVHNLLVQPALQCLFRPLFPVLRSSSMPISTNDSLAPFPLLQSWIGFRNEDFIRTFPSWSIPW